MTKTNKEGPPGYDWHAWQPPLEEDPDNEGASRPGQGKVGKDCEVCGLDQEALVHQVDDSGNPTREAQIAAEVGEAG